MATARAIPPARRLTPPPVGDLPPVLHEAFIGIPRRIAALAVRPSVAGEARFMLRRRGLYMGLMRGAA